MSATTLVEIKLNTAFHSKNQYTNLTGFSELMSMKPAEMHNMFDLNTHETFLHF